MSCHNLKHYNLIFHQALFHIIIHQVVEPSKNTLCSAQGMGILIAHHLCLGLKPTKMET